jgi:hypothetical protein
MRPALSAGRSPGVVRDYVSLSKPIPNLAKSSQARPKAIKENQRKKLGSPLIVFADLGFFKRLRRPPKAKNFFPLLYPPPASRLLPRFTRRAGIRYHSFWFLQSEF